jgi:hypothetical protein
MGKEEIYIRFETFEDKFEKRLKSLELGRERSAENDAIEIQEVNKTLFGNLLFYICLFIYKNQKMNQKDV